MSGCESDDSFSRVSNKSCSAVSVAIRIESSE